MPAIEGRFNFSVKLIQKLVISPVFFRKGYRSCRVSCLQVTQQGTVPNTST